LSNEEVRERSVQSFEFSERDSRRRTKDESFEERFCEAVREKGRVSLSLIDATAGTKESSLETKSLDNFLIFEWKFRDRGNVSECRGDFGESICVNDFFFDEVPVIAKGSYFLDRRLSSGETS
jgi:hypothetical protein